MVSLTNTSDIKHAWIISMTYLNKLNSINVNYLLLYSLMKMNGNSLKTFEVIELAKLLIFALLFLALFA